MIKPDMIERKDGIGSGNHPQRYDDTRRQRHVIISTCGFYSTKGNYDGIISLFNHLLGYHQYQNIFCGQGELFHIDYFQDITNHYLQYVQQAGKEFMKGNMTPMTQKYLRPSLLSKEVYEQMANSYFNERIEEKLT